MFWDTLDMSVFLPSEKLLEIQQLAPASLQRQSITVPQVTSFLGKTTFCANGDAKIFQSDILNVYHFHGNLLLYFHLSLPAQRQLQRLCQFQQRLAPI